MKLYVLEILILSGTKIKKYPRRYFEGFKFRNGATGICGSPLAFEIPHEGKSVPQKTTTEAMVMLP